MLIATSGENFMFPSSKFDPAAWQPEIQIEQFSLDNSLICGSAAGLRPGHPVQRIFTKFMPKVSRTTPSFAGPEDQTGGKI
jgi:hypothetical protein